MSIFTAHKHKGYIDVMLIVTLLILSVLSTSVAILAQSTLNSSNSSKIALQAQSLSESYMNYTSLLSYDDIIDIAKTEVPNTNYSVSIDVETGPINTPPESETLEGKTVSVNIYFKNEQHPRHTLKKIFYKNGSSQYVFNDNNPDNRISMGYDDNRIITKIDEEELKLLTNVTPIYVGALNNLTDTGFYSGSDLGNAPDDGSYYIENIRHSTSEKYYIDQKITSFTSGKILHRQCRNGVWSDWEEFGSDVTGDLSPNGWIRFSNGFLMQWGTYANNTITFPVAFKSFAQVIPSATSKSYEWGDSPHVSQPITISLTGAELKSYWMTGQDANQWGGVKASGRYIAVGM